MDERISFLSHQGQKVMIVDFHGCNEQEMLALLDEVQRVVAQHPRNSLLTLADLNDAHVDRAVATRMKEVLVLDRPYVKRSAWIGSNSLPKVYRDNIRSFSQRTFAHFDSREEALDWLVKEDPAPDSK
jgi:hypothetical protein